MHLPHSTNTQTTQEKQGGTQPGHIASEPHSNTQGVRYKPVIWTLATCARPCRSCMRGTNRQFFVRVEDIDQQRSTPTAQRRRRFGSAGAGMGREVIYQQSLDIYEKALAKLPHYECYCSRKDIQEAASAPHAIPGQYPGTCRDLSDEERAEKRALLADASRVPALRLRSEVSTFTVFDELAGEYTGDVDDMILRRGGNANQIGPLGPDWAYNLAVVVDDAEQGIDQVVRGDDLLSSAPGRVFAQLLGYDIPQYVHVPLVLNDKGQRLAKRDGAVTLREMLKTTEIASIIEQLAQSLGYFGIHSADELLEAFDPQDFAQQEAAHQPFTWTANT